mmetsp:Transcript_10183/g.37710  ORF Transcript_10183/g.37710 Transcript_10183/m.37710 type:complete len:233 (-) Transcript_10183:458-1156(-)
MTVSTSSSCLSSNAATAQDTMESSWQFMEGAAAAAAPATRAATQPPPRPSRPHAHATFATCCDSSLPLRFCSANHPLVSCEASALLARCAALEASGSFCGPVSVVLVGSVVVSQLFSDAFSDIFAIAHNMFATSCALNSLARSCMIPKSVTSSSVRSTCTTRAPSVASAHATLETPCAVQSARQSVPPLPPFFKLAAMLSLSRVMISWSTPTPSLAQPHRELESSWGLNFSA